MNRRFLVATICIVLGVVSISYSLFYFSAAPELPFPDTRPSKFWTYQCVDTMKSSRDRAREWIKRADIKEEITRQISIISSLGATCVSIGTPYDEEFVPYMRLWVEEAHKAHLFVWFRGNFSGWEGWFSYSRFTSPEEHIAKTKNFIIAHADLFSDGDIFTSAPEAENGGPFVGGTDYAKYRSFLQNSYSTCQDSFTSINRRVVCNWFSMSGGQAKSIFNSEFTKQLGSIVTLDHYVKNPNETTEYIQYFSTNFDSKVVLGEFGAPIPDLNGTLNPVEQADFVRSLLTRMVQDRDHIVGVNYWTLLEGSTMVLNADYSERPVADTLRNFFIPGVLIGRVVDQQNHAVPQARIQIKGTTISATADSEGFFSLQLPSDNYSVLAFNRQNESQEIPVYISRNEQSFITLRMR